MAECGLSCAKYWVFFFNLLFALTGLAVLIVGGVTQYSYNHYSNFVGDTWFSAPILMMILGGVIFVVAFFGCCGAIKESSCLIFSFSMCLLAIILFEIGIGAAGFIKHKDLEGIVNNGFNKTLTHYEDNKLAWQLLQTEFTCCGVKGPDDWASVPSLNNTLPKECCKQLAVNATCIRTDKGNVIEDGCKDKLFEFLDHKAVIFGAVGLAVAFIQIIGLSYACYLYRVFRRNYESV